MVVNEDTETETEHSGFPKMQGKVSEGELSNTSAIVEVRNEQDDTVPGCKESQNPILTRGKTRARAPREVRQTKEQFNIRRGFRMVYRLEEVLRRLVF